MFAFMLKRIFNNNLISMRTQKFMVSASDTEDNEFEDDFDDNLDNSEDNDQITNPKFSANLLKVR